ncbi:MAG TPA: hypothetical protein VHM30_17575, partial [Gemmatimonadaceae bacterium]|nr:hypothetical protein [Gemmatimonadaceae bacterium]
MPGRPDRRTIALVLLALATPVVAGAQRDTTPAPPIQDNSFLVEEAYNQERGVVQHISAFLRERTGRAWSYSFTQEWPAPGQRHQLSYSIPIVQLDGAPATRGVGDVALNYRYQLRGLAGERVAIAPRLSLLVPTGSASKGTGAGGAGVQLNLPLSAELSRTVVTHLNAGTTLTPRARSGGYTARTTSWNAGQSVIWLVTQRVNFMLEAAWSRVESPRGDGEVSRESQLLVSPGVRWAYD